MVYNDNGEGELSDAASVLDCLQQYNTNSKICWVVGFFFWGMGCNAIINEEIPEINGFISVSPPASLEILVFWLLVLHPYLIIHGDKDNIASFDPTKILAEKLQKQKKVNIKFKPIKGG